MFLTTYQKLYDFDAELRFALAIFSPEKRFLTYFDNREKPTKKI
jgi:hypothetical protein